jgi:hypothetical protein
MAAPFAAGVVALIWSMHPSRTAAQITTDVSHVTVTATDATGRTGSAASSWYADRACC